MDGFDYRAARKRKGLTQQQLAIRAGCSVAMVRYIEGGAVPRKSQVAQRLREILDPTVAKEANLRNRQNVPDSMWAIFELFGTEPVVSVAPDQHGAWHIVMAVDGGYSDKEDAEEVAAMLVTYLREQGMAPLSTLAPGLAEQGRVSRQP